jgi:uncharacterized protein
MHCPKCFSAMETFSFKELRVDRCSACKGLWFQPGVLAQLRNDSQEADRILDPGQVRIGRQYNEVRDIRCPECNASMDQQTDPDQRHITYESCPQGHGIFLDAGEFTDLVHKTFWDRFKFHH